MTNKNYKELYKDLDKNVLAEKIRELLYEKQESSQRKVKIHPMNQAAQNLLDKAIIERYYENK